MNNSRRIRYTEVNDSTLQSVRTYHTDSGINLRIMINLTSLEYLLLDDKNGIVKQGKGLYLHDTKIKAKKALSDLGVSFMEENRTRNQENAG
jgi:hypothetical protein